MLNQIKTYLFGGAAAFVGFLLLLLKIKSNKVEQLKDDIEVERKNTQAVEAALAQVEKDRELENKSDEIHDSNAASSGSIDRLRDKYQRD